MARAYLCGPSDAPNEDLDLLCADCIPPRSMWGKDCRVTPTASRSGEVCACCGVLVRPDPYEEESGGMFLASLFEEGA